MMGKAAREEEGPGGELRFLTRASEAPRGREQRKAREGMTGCKAHEVGKREVVRNVATIRDLIGPQGTRSPRRRLNADAGRGRAQVGRPQAQAF